jgi:hypothetical protein
MHIFCARNCATVIGPCDFSRNPAKNRVTGLLIIRTVTWQKRRPAPLLAQA